MENGQETEVPIGTLFPVRFHSTILEVVRLPILELVMICLNMQKTLCSLALVGLFIIGCGNGSEPLGDNDGGMIEPGNDGATVAYNDAGTSIGDSAVSRNCSNKHPGPCSSKQTIKSEEEFVEYIYDSNGNLIKQNVERTSLDIVNKTTISYVYDQLGNLITENKDEKADGTIERVTTYKYDSAGKIITKEYDIDNDGTLDGITTYNYNSKGELEGIVINWDAVSEDTQREYYTYDEHGRLAIVEFDDNDDGEFDRKGVYLYDESGAKIGADLYSPYNDDERLVGSTRYYYDSNCNLLKTKKSSGDFTDFDYSCW